MPEAAEDREALRRTEAGERVALAFGSVRYPGGMMCAWLFSDSDPQELS